MDLDALKTRFEARDQTIDALLRMNVRALGAPLLSKSETAARRLRRLLVLELVANGVAALLTGSFLADHVSEPRFLVPAAALHLLVLALVGLAVRQLVALARVDYGAPVVEIQKGLERLRAERIRAAVGTFLLAPLAWTPLVLVAAKGLAGIDAWSLAPAWHLASLAFGVLWLVVGLQVTRRIADRVPASHGLQRFFRHLGGASLAEAEGFIASLSELESHEAETGA